MQPGDLSIILPEIILSIYAMGALLIGVYGGKDKLAPALVWGTSALFVVVGLAPGASFANVPALNQEQSDQALANGAIAQLGNVGTACSVPLLAAVATFGMTGLLLTLIVVSALGLLNVWLIHRNIAKSA